MINKTIQKLKQMNWLWILPVLLFFIYMLYTNQSVTLMADDFRYSMRSAFNFILPQERITSFPQIFQTAYYDYFSLGARYGTVILTCFVLMFGAELFKIVSPLVLTMSLMLGAYLVLHLNPKSNKNKLLAIILIILLFSFISPAVMDEDVYWITGTITYCWPALFILLFISLYLLPQNNGNKKVMYFPILILSIYLGSTSENISITTTIITSFIIGYKIWREKDKQYFTGIRKFAYIVLVVANLIQILSPGTRNRASVFETSFLINLFSGLFSFIQYQFFLSSWLPVLLLVLILMILIQCNKRLFILSLLTLLPLIVSIILFNLPNNSWIYNYEIICYFIMPLDFMTWNQGLNTMLYVVSLYYVFVIFILVLDIIVICTKKKDFNLFILFLFSTCSLLALIPIGGAVPRVSYVAIFFMMLTSTYIIMFYLLNRFILIPIVILSIMNYSSHLNYLKENVEVAKQRIEIIEDIDLNSNQLISLPEYRFSTHGNFNKPDTWEHYMFKLYYGITNRDVIFD